MQLPFESFHRIQPLALNPGAVDHEAEVNLPIHAGGFNRELGVGNVRSERRGDGGGTSAIPVAYPVVATVATPTFAEDHVDSDVTSFSRPSENDRIALNGYVLPTSVVPVGGLIQTGMVTGFPSESVQIVGLSAA